MRKLQISAYCFYFDKLIVGLSIFHLAQQIV